jgi:hypothetical protein
MKQVKTTLVQGKALLKRGQIIEKNVSKKRDKSRTKELNERLILKVVTEVKLTKKAIHTTLSNIM